MKTCSKEPAPPASAAPKADPPPARPAPLPTEGLEARWHAVGSVLGIRGPITAVVAGPGDKVYVGGDVAIAGQAEPKNVAMWDGASWSTLGTGLNGHVDTLAVDGAGNLYARGAFSQPAGCVARWDGTAWSALGAGLACCAHKCEINIGASALVVDGSNNLYSADFTEKEEEVVKKWDGTSWSSLGSPEGGVALLAGNRAGVLYALSQLNPMGDQGRSYYGQLSKWNGSAWESLSEDEFGWNVSFLAVDDAERVYLGGNGEVRLGNDEKWPPLGGRHRLPFEASALVADPAGTIYAGGASGQLARWNGRAWKTVGASDDDFFPAALEPGGRRRLYGLRNLSRHTATNRPLFQLGRWDGHEWSPLGCAVGDVTSLAVDRGGSSYAATSTHPSDGHADVYKWDGQAWQALGGGLGHTVRALAWDGAGILYAGGDSSAGEKHHGSEVARWDGKAWSALGGGLGSVRALVVAPDGTPYASGRQEDGHFAVAVRKGGAWQRLLEIEPGGVVEGLALDGAGNLYAGGRFDSPGKNVTRWDGKTWSALGTGIAGPVHALATSARGTVFAGGEYRGPGGSVARWDGASWSAVGALNWAVQALAIGSDGALYAGGQSMHDGYLVRWDGTKWLELRSGTNGQVRALALDHANQLWVGGHFALDAGNPTCNVARFDLRITPLALPSAGQSHPDAPGTDQGTDHR